MNFKYEVIVQGDRAPFKWEVRRNGTVYPLGKDLDDNHLYPRGEADTFEEAVEAAREIARQQEDHRRYDATRQTVLLFEVPETVEIPDTLPEGGFDG